MTATSKTWTDYHQDAIEAGMDDAGACHAADEAIQRAVAAMSGEELPDIGLYDSATGADLPTLKMVDVTIFQTRAKEAHLLFAQAKRGRIVQLRTDGMRIHYFMDEPSGQEMMAEDCARFGFVRGGLYTLAARNAPEPIHIPEVQT